MMEDVADEDRKLILVIDSDPTDLVSIDNALRRAGYDVVCAQDGNYVLALAERDRPDLIITDTVAARRSGYLVIERLRTHETVPSKIIVLTSVDSETGRKYLGELAVDAYMTKPYVTQDLLDTVERVLNDE